MSAVLEKTKQSLEAALRYNPQSVELMASLAEVYIRLGQFDDHTMELCDTVLRDQPENPLLDQARSIGQLIDEARQIEQSLDEGGDLSDSPSFLRQLELLEQFSGIHQ